MRGISDLARAKEFLGTEYVAELNVRFTVRAAEKGSAFVRAQRKDLDWIFSLQHEHIGYREAIDPDCLRRIRSKERNVISDAKTFERWLGSA